MRAMKLVLNIGVIYLLVSFVSLRQGEGVAGGGEEIPIFTVGLDQAGNQITRSIPASVFSKSMAQAFASIHTAILPALADHASQATKPAAWELRTIGVGLGLSGTIGLGPIWSVTASPKLRLIFTDSVNPVYPD